MVRIALIGCGWIVRTVYLPALAQRSDVDIAAVYDPDPQSLQAVFMHYPNFTWYKSLDSVWWTRADAVIVASPNSTHTAYSKASLLAGRHVLCEKPIALSATEAVETVQLAKNVGKIYFPAFAYRFRQDVKYFHGEVLKIGRIHSIRTEWVRRSGIPRPGTWITDRNRSGGGVLVDLGSHMLDICMRYIEDTDIQTVWVKTEQCDDYLANQAGWNGPPETRTGIMDVETRAEGQVLFQSGQKLSFDFNWAGQPVDGDRTIIEITGSGGKVYLDSLFGFSDCSDKIQNTVTTILQNEEPVTKIFPMAKNADYSRQAFQEMIDCFIKTIHGDRKHESKDDVSVSVVRLIERLYRSEGGRDEWAMP